MEESVLLERVAPEKNIYRWYRLSLTIEDQDSLFRFHQVTIQRGRIGQEGETINRTFINESEARDFFARRIQEKQARGYVQVGSIDPLFDERCDLCYLVQHISEEPRVIYEFRNSVFILNRDQTYRGRSMLVFRRHIPDFFRLAPSQLLSSLGEIRRSEGAVRRAFSPALLNYLFMGNRAGHVHLHIVPRYSSDPNFGNSPFLETSRTLAPQKSEEEYRSLVDQIRQHLP